MRINHIVKVSDQGVSRPYQCYDEKGELRWCKGHHTGLRAVMAEWICARIAHALGIPVPSCDILYLDPMCFQRWCADKDALMPALVTPTNPYVFASLNVPEAKDVTDAKTELTEEDPVLLARIYAFDAFIRNTDRTDFNSNLLINGGIHVIDHNNAFDPGFDLCEFARTHILRDSFVSVSDRDRKEFEDLIRGTITVDFLGSAWSEMPDAWTDAGSDVFSFESILSVLGLEA